jgi:hypothetical protein
MKGRLIHEAMKMGTAGFLPWPSRMLVPYYHFYPFSIDCKFHTVLWYKEIAWDSDLDKAPGL